MKGYSMINFYQDIEENIKAIGIILYLIYRVVIGLRPSLERDINFYIKKLGGYRKIIDYISFAETVCDATGPEKQKLVADRIRIYFKEKTGEDLPPDIINLIIEIALQRYKKMF
jgi:hypothetical protein